MKRTVSLIAACLLAGSAFAKLPALNDEAKAKAAEAAAKTAWSGKVDAYLLCKAQDKVAAAYFKMAKVAGHATKPAAATPPCADPGPFVYTPPEAKPLEAAGAHSPPATATSPPSGKQTDAVVNPAAKKP